MRIATVKIKNSDGGSVLVNECDFDPELHEKAGDERPANGRRGRKKAVKQEDSGALEPE